MHSAEIASTIAIPKPRPYWMLETLKAHEHLELKSKLGVSTNRLLGTILFSLKTIQPE
jgi:hypothetical protein